VSVASDVLFTRRWAGERAARTDDRQG